ncbi:DUF6119 family protein [Nonomuraea sp. NPDC049709]|uniref:DUF6119 family protein n=1 Tax=Nonomuraea sp. NPDC049709 TaxID=3154736 RepID=UPI003419AFFB
MVDSQAKLRFNCYLLKEEVTDPAHALRAPYRPGGSKEMIRLSPSSSAPAGVVAYFSARSEKVPGWAQALTPLFPDLSQALNTSNRLVVFLPVAERHFAVCWGYGQSTLEHSAIESNFGLRFAARCLDPESLHEVRSRRIDASSRTQSVQVPKGSDLRDLDVPLEGEFVRKLSGRLGEVGVEFSDLGAVVATNSIAFNTTTDLAHVQEVLGDMMREVEQRAALDELTFVDALEPLRNGDELVDRLETLLMELLREQPADDAGSAEPSQDLKHHLLEFSPPDDVRGEDIDSITIQRGGASFTMHEATLGELRKGIAALGGRLGRKSLTSIKLMAHGHEGEPVSMMLPLKNWLVFEAGDAQRRLILTLGKWFALSEDYTRQLNEDLLKIQVITTHLALPAWDTTVHPKEGDYNKAAASARPDLVLLDQVDIRAGDKGEIEACDLLHEEGYLIHVKKYSASHTLSHLFSQGTVSAQAIASDDVYRDAFIKAVTAENPVFRKVAENAPERVTYAIAFKGMKKLPEELPTFSKVNLRDFVKRLRNLRIEASLCRIQITR